MKKSKIMLSTLAAAVFATSAGALVACGEDVQLPSGLADKGVIEITLDANGGLFSNDTAVKKVKTNINGLLAPLSEDLKPERPGWQFTGYYLEQEQDGTTEIKYGANGYKFEAAITVYAHWKQEEQGGEHEGDSEYTVTLDAGVNGSYSSATLTTVGGKLTGLTNAVANSGWTSQGWYTQPDGQGTKVTADTPITNEITTIYAHYTANQGGEQGDTEYTFELVVQNGSYSATTLTTVGGKLTTLTNATADDGYSFEGWYTEPNGQGTYVTSDTPLTESGKLYAYIIATRPTYDPEAPNPQYTAVSINGTAMTNNTSSIDRSWVDYPDYHGYANHNQTDEFMATLTVEQQTTYSLTADSTPITTLWIKASGIEAKVGNVFAPENGTEGSEFGLVAGVYTLYFKVYQDGGRVLEITGSQTGEWENVNVRPSTDPNPPARVYTTATVNDNDMTDVTSEVGRQWDADNECYKNHTLADEFKYEITLDEQTTLAFKIGGKSTDGMWVKRHKDVKVKVNGVEIRYDGQTGSGDGANSNDGTIVVPAGTYKFYLTNYGTDGDDDLVLWVEGSTTGEFGGGGGGGEQTELPTVSVKNGENEIALVHNPDNTTATYEFKLATGNKVSLTQGDVLTVLINGESPAPNFNIVNSHGATYVGNQITITDTGEFTFYLRYYEEGTWWNVEINDGKTDEIHEGHYYLVGAGQDFDVCYENRYVGETSGEIEVTVGNSPVSFKLAKSTATGATDWTSNTHLGSNDVTVGRGYVTSDNDGNIVLTTPGTYTVKLVDGHIEITSDDVEENTNTPYTANVTLADGKKVKITFAMPTNWGLSAAELNSGVITINGTKSINIKSDSSVDLDASDIALGNVTVKVSFQQNGGNKITSGEITLEDGASYIISFGSWIEDVPGGATFEFNVSKS